MADMITKHGSFSFNELITTDLDSAKKFYSELLGWEYRETKSIHGQVYVTALKDGKVVAGMMLKEGNVDDDVMPCWDPYITVDNVEEGVKIVKKNGGTILGPPTNIPGEGRFATIMDPQGIVFNIISPTEK